MTRLQRILAGLIVLQLIVTALVFWPRQSAAAVTALFEGVDQAQVTQMTITDGATDAQIKLVKSGGGWTLEGTDGFPADPNQIDTALNKLTALKTNRLIATSPVSQTRLQVAAEKFVRRIDLTVENGQSYTLYIGSSPSAGATHVRRADQNNIYATKDVTNFDLNTAVTGWINSAYFTLSRDDVNALTLTNANGVFRFSKAVDGTWSLAGVPADRTYDPAMFNTLLSRFVRFTLAQPLGQSDKPEYGLTPPQATVDITTTQTVSDTTTVNTYTLLVGAKQSDDNYVVKWSDSPYYVKAASFSVESMVSNALENFLQALPTPTPESNVAPTESIIPAPTP